MSVKLFEWYGKFCAFYALEVIVFFLTLVVGAITLNLSSPHELCHWAATSCFSQNEVSSDVVLLTVLRCGTIIYAYMQLKQLWKTDSMCIVGIVCTYMVFAVITFTVTLVHFLRKDLVIVSSALPVFLLIMDISRMTTLTKHCLSMSSIELLQDYIAEGMGALTPMLTLDTLVELLLLVNIGGYVEIRQVQQLSCFACLSVIINFVAFSTFVPASLSVLLTAINKNPLAMGNISLPPSWQDLRFAGALKKENHDRKTLFTSRFKVIICLPLIVLHWFRHLMFQGQGVVKMQNSFDSILTLTPEQFFTLVLIIILTSKYLFDDGYEIVSRFRRPSEELQPVNYDKLVTLKEIGNPVTPLKVTGVHGELESSSDIRSVEKCMELLNIGSDLLNDQEILQLVKLGKIPPYKLEVILCDANRGVSIRRKLLRKKVLDLDALNHIPFAGYDFTKATKACCENTIGYIPLPVGLVGPLLLEGKEYMIPMATTEGTLLASTNRGLKALFKSGGVSSCVYADGMSRAPVVGFPTSTKACEVLMWLQDSSNYAVLKDKFDETSRFARLKCIMPVVSGRLLFIRFVASTGDAMGMNMLSKGAENSLRWMKVKFPDMQVISVSGNFCTDKKASAVNWIMGRGKSVVCEATLPSTIVRSILKTEIETLVHLNRCKNHIGSAMSGSIGGYNAHAANIVTALFLATGQDPAQNVVSSNCITTLDSVIPNIDDQSGSDKHLLITCTMPSLEVATVGGGCSLDPQNACLKLLGVAGSSTPLGKAGEHATKLAKIVCATVLAGELSLLSALDSGDLVQSHMKHNRLPKSVPLQEHSIL